MRHLQAGRSRLVVVNSSFNAVPPLRSLSAGEFNRGVQPQYVMYYSVNFDFYCHMQEWKSVGREN